MESQRFVLNEMMKVVYKLVEKLPAPKSCSAEELDELWNKLLEEYEDLEYKLDTTESCDCAKMLTDRLKLVERDLENVEEEWFRRHPENNDDLSGAAELFVL